MDDQYRPDLKAHVVTDPQGTVRQVFHTDERWLPATEVPRAAAVEYVREQAALYTIPQAALERLHEPVTYGEPRQEGGSYRLAEEKRQFDAVTVAFAQTHLNVPVWRTGVSVTIKTGPSRVVESSNTSLREVRAELPPDDVVARWRQMMDDVARRPPPGGEQEPEPTVADRVMREALGLEGRGRDRPTGPQVEQLRVNRGRFFVYRYDPDARQPSPPDQPDREPELERDDIAPTLPLPPVPDEIRPGQDYLVVEVLFTLPVAGLSELNWRALVEVETNAVVYLRALIAGVNGLVFRMDPITKTGDTTNTAAQPNATLNALRDDEPLLRLDGPVAGTQSLTGSLVRVEDADAPSIAPPTRPAGNDFDNNARTNDFAAVSAYYHGDALFATIEDLGFALGTYFDGTALPARLDHRASISTVDGVEVNAFCAGNATGDGIGLVGYCLADLTDTANPLGRAVDKYVHWHEVGGHGILWDHVDSPNFGFAHSAGDGLAAIQNDPESELRELGLVERFRYAPFRPLRWLNRDVATGWGWGGSNDIGGYSSEQVLGTSHFRIYQSIGGDADNLGRRRLASRVMTYLIVRAVGDLTPMTNPGSALAWCNRLMATDLLDWTTEGLAGGAYNKVIRWAFEQQGLFQPPGAPTPVTSPGAPPAVDVYIDDGRGGEYPYQRVHWNTTTIWNRQAADGMPGHQPAVEGATNYAYVRVRNRGTTDAGTVTVRGFHSLPGAGLTWPVDFTAMSPAAGLTAPSIPANDAGEVTIGPFEWSPNLNAYGHDCVLMIASTDGDPSNVDNFGPGETIEEWRLVPHDNNVGQRNVAVVPGGGGGEGLLAGLHEHIFFAGNTFQRRATMHLEARLPTWLARAGWRLRFPGIRGDRFVLAPGQRREITIALDPGNDFTADQVSAAADRDISVTLSANDMVIGGMTYRLDPALKAPPARPDDRRDCRQPARDLLECLDIPAGKVRGVHVKKISFDVCMDDDCC